MKTFCPSWVITERATGKAVFGFFYDGCKINTQQLDRTKYRVQTEAKYLTDFNAARLARTMNDQS